MKKKKSQISIQLKTVILYSHIFLFCFFFFLPNLFLLLILFFCKIVALVIYLRLFIPLFDSVFQLLLFTFFYAVSFFSSSSSSSAQLIYRTDYLSLLICLSNYQLSKKKKNKIRFTVMLLKIFNFFFSHYQLI